MQMFTLPVYLALRAILIYAVENPALSVLAFRYGF
jgi:hypothetical protein